MLSVDRGHLTIDEVTDKLLLCLHVSLGAHVVHGQLCEWVLLRRHGKWLHYLSHHLGCLLHRLSWCLLRQWRAHFRECLLVENRRILLRPLVLIPGLVIWLVLRLSSSLLVRVLALVTVLVTALILLTRLILVRLLVVVEALLVRSWVLCLWMLSL